MGDRADELRSDIDSQRRDISDTLGQIEDRVSPSGAVSRGRERARTALAELREGFGSGGSGPDGSDPDVADQASDALGRALEALRDQTRRNPVAAVLVAFGAGFVIASRLRR